MLSVDVGEQQYGSPVPHWFYNRLLAFCDKSEEFRDVGSTLKMFTTGGSGLGLGLGAAGAFFAGLAGEAATPETVRAMSAMMLVICMMNLAI